MIGSIIKYTAVAFAGGVIFAVCMFSADEAAFEKIKDSLAIYAKLQIDEGKEGEELKLAMADYIRSNRSHWDKTYTLAETQRRVQDLYATYI